MKLESKWRLNESCNDIPRITDSQKDPTLRLDNCMSIYLSKLMPCIKCTIRLILFFHDFLQISHPLSRRYSCWQRGSYPHQETFSFSSHSMLTSFGFYDSVYLTFICSPFSTQMVLVGAYCHHYSCSETYFHSSGDFHLRKLIEHLFDSEWYQSWYCWRRCLSVCKGPHRVVV